jgi:hypothetical protein
LPERVEEHLETDFEKRNTNDLEDLVRVSVVLKRQNRSLDLLEFVSREAFLRIEAMEPEAPSVLVNASGRLRTINRPEPFMRNDRLDEHEFLSRLLDGAPPFNEVRNATPEEFQFVISLEEVTMRSEK